MNKKLQDFLIYKTPLGLLRTIWNCRVKSHTQSNENAILLRLTACVKHPKTFVEFGFNAHEFNCIGLVKTYSGLLIDGDERTIAIARRALPSSVEAMTRFLTLDSLSIVEEKYPVGSLGILSVDVDGNDYWFLERLIHLRPSIISVEYNASFGKRHIVIPYDPEFIRANYHHTGWYHGASLSAMAYLCGKHSYDLVAVSGGGTNAFFVRSDLRDSSLPKLSADEAFRENILRNQWSGTNAEDQWNAVRGMPYVNVG